MTPIIRGHGDKNKQPASKRCFDGKKAKGKKIFNFEDQNENTMVIRV